MHAEAHSNSSVGSFNHVTEVSCDSRVDSLTIFLAIFLAGLLEGGLLQQ